MGSRSRWSDSSSSEAAAVGIESTDPGVEMTLRSSKLREGMSHESPDLPASIDAEKSAAAFGRKFHLLSGKRVKESSVLQESTETQSASSPESRQQVLPAEERREAPEETQRWHRHLYMQRPAL